MNSYNRANYSSAAQNGLVQRRASEGGPSSMRDFTTLTKIGSGAYSDVFKVTRKSDNQTYALKKVRTIAVSAHNLAGLLNVLFSESSSHVSSYMCTELLNFVFVNRYAWVNCQPKRRTTQSTRFAYLLLSTTKTLHPTRKLSWMVPAVIPFAL